MADAAQSTGAGPQDGATSLGDAIHKEGMEPAGTVQQHEGVVPHTDPQALGMDATAWVSLAMAIFILILLVKKVPAWIGRGLDAKIAAIRSQLDEATKLRTEAEALKREYEAKLAGAEQEAAAMRARAEDESSQLLDDARVHATELVARRQKMAEDKISAAERTAIAQVRAKAVEAATSAAKQLIAQTHDAQADRRLIDSSIQKLGPVV